MADITPEDMEYIDATYTVVLTVAPGTEPDAEAVGAALYRALEALDSDGSCAVERIA